VGAPSKNVLVAGALAGAALFLAGILAGTAISKSGRPSREGGGVLAGASSGRSAPSAPRAPASAGRSTAGVTGAATGGGAGRDGLMGGRSRAGAAHGGHDHGDALEGGEGEAGVPSGPTLSLDEAIAKLAAEPSGAFAGRYAQELLRDKRAMEAALARFRGEADAAKLEALAFLLAQARTPDVEALAAELSLRGDRAHRLAALGLLDQFETPASLGPVAETLRSERDPALVAAAVYALPEPRGASAQEAASVVEGLRRALASTDAEARRRAAIALASWLPPSEAEPLLGATLERDPEAIVRAVAAFGLEVIRPRLEVTVLLLAQVTARRTEERPVRENAWRALGSVGPLPAELAAVYRAFEEEMEARED